MCPDPRLLRGNDLIAPGLAKHLAEIPVAATMAAAARARALRAQGIDVISLSLGEPDFASPPHVVEAARAAAVRGETKYPPVDGTVALREAVRRKFARDSGLEYAADAVIVGHGARQVIFDALTAMLDPGDEVLIPVPTWNAYPIISQMAGAVPVFVACRQEEDFLPRAEDIEAAITPRTKILVLNFPNNPTGAVFPAAHLRKIAAVMLEHPRVWILSDDMYEHLIHDGTPHATIAAIEPRLRDRVLTVSGVSKTYAMTGWRVGFAGGPARLIRAMSKVQGQSTGGVSPINCAAAVAALDGPQDLVAIMRATYGARRDRVAAALNAIDGIRCHRPAGAFYLYPNIGGFVGRVSGGGRLIGNDADFAAALLDEGRVATVHGAAFYMSPYIRLSTAAGDATLDEACARIKLFCEGFV